uniref:Uncharacterized protein n=1 Tax=Parascaris univalens TaxID=6257 RepID=A0A915AZH6_PARUN
MKIFDSIIIAYLLIILHFIDDNSAELDMHSDKHNDRIVPNFKSNKDEHIESENHLKLYRNAFKLKRREQLNAVKTIFAMDNLKKRNTLIIDLINRMQKVIDEAKQLIMKCNYTVGGVFPFANTQLKEAIGNVVENTAFFCEFALRFPSVVGKKYWNDRKFRSTIEWAYKFSEIADLYDDTARRLLNLAGQELHIIEREENFINPYDKRRIKEQIEREAVKRIDEEKERKQREKKMEIKKKKERKPTLTKTEL